MDATQASARRLEALVPAWYDTLMLLELRFAITRGDYGELQGIGVEWRHPTLPHEPSLRSFEAIGVLALLAHVAPSLWVKTLQAVGVIVVPVEEFVMDNFSTLPPIRSVEIQMRSGQDCVRLCEFLTSIGGGVPTDYLAFRDRAGEGGLEQFVLSARIASAHAPIFYEDPTLLPVLRALEGLSALQQAHHSSRSSSSSSLLAMFNLLIDEADVYRLLHPRLNVEAVGLMGTIAQSGIKVPRVGGCFIEPTHQNAAVVVASLQALFGVHTTTERHAFVARRVQIAPELNQRTLTPAFFSAIASSGSIDRIDVSTAYLHAASPEAARWFAYAAFHFAQDSHTQAKLKFDGVPRSVTTAVIGALASVNDPLLLLFGDHHASICQFQTVRVSASSFVLYDPFTTTGQDNFVVEHLPQHGLRVLARLGGYWSVLLPGWGQAWVRESGASVASGHNSFKPRLRWIEVCGIRADQEADLFAFLETIGPHIGKLVLNGEDQSQVPLDLWVPRILDTCRNVEDVTLATTNPMHLLTVTQCLLTRPSNLKKLKLSIHRLKYDVVAHVMELLHAVADLHTNQLESFSFSASGMEYSYPARNPGLVDALARLLDTNCQLTNVVFDIPFGVATIADRDAFQKRVRRHNGGPARAFLRYKLAFLSAMWGDITRSPAAAVTSQLDHRVLSKILQFAAIFPRRSIYVAQPEVAEDNEMDGADDDDFFWMR